MTAPVPPALDLGRILDAAPRRTAYSGRLRRVVLRMGEADIRRLDDVRAQLRRGPVPRLISRAALTRVLVFFALALVSPEPTAPPPDRCEP